MHTNYISELLQRPWLPCQLNWPDTLLISCGKVPGRCPSCPVEVDNVEHSVSSVSSVESIQGVLQARYGVCFSIAPGQVGRCFGRFGVGGLLQPCSRIPPSPSTVALGECEFLNGFRSQGCHGYLPANLEGHRSPINSVGTSSKLIYWR